MSWTALFLPRLVKHFLLPERRQLPNLEAVGARGSDNGSQLAPSAPALDQANADNGRFDGRAPEPEVQGDGVDIEGADGREPAAPVMSDAECARIVILGDSIADRFGAFTTLVQRHQPHPILEGIRDFRAANAFVNLVDEVAMCRCIEFISQYRYRFDNLAVGSLSWDDLVAELHEATRLWPLEGPLDSPVRVGPRRIRWANVEERELPTAPRARVVTFNFDEQVGYTDQAADHDEDTTEAPELVPAKPVMLSEKRGFVTRLVDALLPRFTIFSKAATNLHADEVRVSFRNATVDDEPELKDTPQHRVSDVLLGAKAHGKYHRAANRWHQRLRLLRKLREELIFESSEVKRVRTDANVAWIAIGARKLVAKNVEEGVIDRRHARWFRAALTETFFLKDDDDEFVETLRGSFGRAW